MKKLTTAKIWQFAAGQFGWAMLSGIISNWLVYFYQPDKTAISQGQTVFIPQGLVALGIFTIIGGITAFGRIFDAFTDPMIASWSDRCTSKNGRRIPFLKWVSLPLALSTVLVFWSPIDKNSWINAAFLLVMILAYYLSITAYCTPYNALIPELGHTQQERLNISTVISFTFIAGTAVAFICMLIPVFCIREKDYVNMIPAKESAFGSLVATFRNGEFRKFVGSDIFYWIALTMFQTGLPFFVTSLLKLPETMTTLYFVGMTALSLVFYVPVNKLTPKLGKKKMFLFAHSMGGAISTIAASWEPELFQKIILSSPMIRPLTGNVPWPITVAIAQAECLVGRNKRYVIGQKPYDGSETLETSAAVSEARFTRYNEIRKKCREIQTSAASYGWLLASIKMSWYIRYHGWRKLSAPILIFQAEKDDFVSVRAIQKFAKKLQRKGRISCEYVYMPGSKHEIFGSDDKTLQAYVERILSFLEKRN